MSIEQNLKGYFMSKIEDQLIEDIKISGLFNEAYYLKQISLNDLNITELIRHYYHEGVKLGLNPCSEFNTTYYLESNPDVSEEGIHPLIHFIYYGRNEGRHGCKLNTRHDSPFYIRAKAIDKDGTLLIKFPEKNLFDKEIDDIVPPKEMMEYGESTELYLKNGHEIVNKMREVLKKLNFTLPRGSKVLEFGCSNARLLRCFFDISQDIELFGVDIQSEKINWCIENLSSWFNFSLCTAIPHLSFRDEYFNFVFAGSAFTHIEELHTQWFLELTRCTKSGGLMYLTFIDERSLEILNSEMNNNLNFTRIKNHSQAKRILDLNFDWISIEPYGQQFLSQVFMTEQYIRMLSRSTAEIVDIIPRAFAKFQTAYVFKVK